MRIVIIAVASLSIFVGASAARANLVTNGSFETTTVTTKSPFLNNVAGWSGGGGLTFIDTPGTADNNAYLSVYGPFPATSPAGGNFVEADGDPGYSGVIYQTINNLVVGQTYTLTFEQAAGQQNGFTGATTEQWQVGFGNQQQLSSLYSLPQGGIGPWELQTMTFVAQATSQALSFLALGTPAGAPPIAFLDGIDLEPSGPSAVPEPATLSLIGLGVVGLFAARRRTKRS